jgi:acetyl-CoA carboxylase carboxyl transferase subunit beta
MSWFRKEKQPRQPVEQKRLKVPEGLWTKCESCGQIIYKKEIARNANVCPKCGYHFRIAARERLEGLYDAARWDEFDSNLVSVDPLEFRDTKTYKARIADSRERTGQNDAVLNTHGTIGGIPVIISAMEYAFMGGSMGSVVGEKVTRAVERAHEERIPLIIISGSGGARMQEGALSLMQMAKISAALANLNAAGIPYLSILTDPTTGGVTASYAMLGDMNIAEPRALIGFAWPRVIEQTIRQTLPEGFQRAEFLLLHGMVDLIVERAAMRDALIRILRLLYDPALAANAVYAAQAADEETARR